jgi:8-oxo-dGTP diphosphatase
MTNDQPLERPKVGMGLLVVKDGQILLGRRKSSHGTGQYGGPGGHLEGMEAFEEGILREVLEEAGPGLKLKNLRFLCVTNLRKYDPKHYVDIGLVAEWEAGEPMVGEPDKLESWAWYPMDDLPSPLFGCMENYIEAYKTGRAYPERVIN